MFYSRSSPLLNHLDLHLPSPLIPLVDAVTRQAGVSLLLKRDDLIHPEVSGNKWRKLYYNVQQALSEGYEGIITFGGAFSNHLYATAAIGKALQLPTLGIVRGDELSADASATLRFCAACGMELHFVSRAEYRDKERGTTYQRLLRLRRLWSVPEGGSNTFALKGVAELAEELRTQLGGTLPDYIAVAIGTGGTAAGLLSAGAQVLGISVLKNGHFLRQDIQQLLGDSNLLESLDLHTRFDEGGYARVTPELVSFIKDFEARHHVPIEQVYTAKMLRGVYTLLQEGYFRPGSVVVAVHTGGLQGRSAALSPLPISRKMT